MIQCNILTVKESNTNWRDNSVSDLNAETRINLKLAIENLLARCKIDQPILMLDFKFVFLIFYNKTIMTCQPYPSENKKL